MTKCEIKLRNFLKEATLELIVLAAFVSFTIPAISGKPLIDAMVALLFFMALYGWFEGWLRNFVNNIMDDYLAGKRIIFQIIALIILLFIIAKLLGAK